MNSAIKKFRFMGFLEGMSLLILLFIAMPLKYFAGYPQAVTVVGSVHGLLFTLYAFTIAYVTYKVRWSFVWVAAAFIVAFIPFGNMMLDSKLSRTKF